MEDKLKQLKETHLKIAQLMEELEEAYKIEEIKKKFPKAKLFSFKKNYNGKNYEVKFLKLESNINVSIFLSDIMFNRFMFKENSFEFKKIYFNQGRITDFEKSVLEKLQVISIKEIGVC